MKKEYNFGLAKQLTKKDGRRMVDVYGPELKDADRQLAAVNIHNSMMAATNNFIHEKMKGGISPRDVSQIENYLFPGGRKLEKKQFIPKTKRQNLEKLQKMKLKGVPNELETTFKNVEQIISQLKKNPSDCKETDFVNQKNTQLDKFLDKLEEKRQKMTANDRVGELVGKPSELSNKTKLANINNVIKENARASSEMKDMLKAIGASIERSNDINEAELELQRAHRHQQFLFRRLVTEYQNKCDAYRDNLMQTINKMSFKVDKIDRNVNKLSRPKREISIWNLGGFLWYVEDIYDLFENLYYLDGIGALKSLLQPIITSMQITVGWLAEFAKALGRLYQCFKGSPILCLFVEVGVILCGLVGLYCLYTLAAYAFPYLIKPVQYLLYLSFKWLKTAFQKIVEFVGIQTIDSVVRVFWEGVDFASSMAAYLWDMMKDGVTTGIRVSVNWIFKKFGAFLTSLGNTLSNWFKKFIWDAVKSRMPGKFWYKDYILDISGVKPMDMKCFSMANRLKIFGYSNMYEFQSCSMSTMVAPFIILETPLYKQLYNKPLYKQLYNKPLYKQLYNKEYNKKKLKF